ncbi:fumarylacetoacetate hydrolase family protein [Variovorax sp. J22P168]|uniref:fumarylacetoacetate hydrolase family protein n=1 Tax=Variovorax jilinensis TaxID=3053513 RepID=UPI00257718D3|nr:fumarylacetoacetate hydrolase family protein [Variovorax sp. J22P168]MDM0015175.1 fumarylacetoacetate hydrolase family protein [Variovorax sp. J22P168]
MKIATFNDHRVGVVQGDQIWDVTFLLPAALDQLPQQRMNWLIAHWAQMGPRLADARTQCLPLASVALLAPNPAPPHVFAAPANYRKHIGELGSRAVTKGGRTAREQGFFLMAPGSISGPGSPIRVPRDSVRRFDHESELAVIIGRAGRNIPREEAMSYVFGYSCLIDATMRIEKDSHEEERSMRKSFETFTPIGPYIVTADEVPDPGRLRNRLWVNGQLKQDANTGEMIVGVAELIELVSSVLPIQPGDIIASGTPEGVGPFGPGDELRIEIESVGTMSLSVQECDARSPRPF